MSVCVCVCVINTSSRETEIENVIEMIQNEDVIQT